MMGAPSQLITAPNLRVHRRSSLPRSKIGGQIGGQIGLGGARLAQGRMQRVAGRVQPDLIA